MPVIKIVHVCSVSSEDPVRKLRKEAVLLSPSSKISLIISFAIDCDTVCMMDSTHDQQSI